MLDKLEGVEKRFLELEKLLSDPEVIKDQAAYRKYMREHAEMSEIVAVYRSHKKVSADIAGGMELMREGDADMKALAREEVELLSQKKSELEETLRKLLVPRDPNDERNVILEIRAGTGGDEAALFAGDLFRMYGRYAENRGWKVDVMNSHPAEVGGFKEIIAMIQGERAYSRLKFESGTHRVQRVPATEAQGRIHTSAVTVAVLPEAEEVDIQVDPGDLRIDIFRSSGPGGQSVNTTDSAVRITYLPTGLIVTCQDEKSQHKNKAKAMKVLLARLYDQKEHELHEKRAEERKGQIGTGDRSGRVRTYNYPQGRVTDHRIGLTLYKLEEILQGSIDSVIDPLVAHHQAQALQDAR